MTGSAKRDTGLPRATTNGSTANSAGHIEPALDRAIQAQIGSKLRAMYGELVEQPVPDRLAAILGQLGNPGRESGS